MRPPWTVTRASHSIKRPIRSLQELIEQTRRGGYALCRGGYRSDSEDQLRFDLDLLKRVRQVEKEVAQAETRQAAEQNRLDLKRNAPQRKAEAEARALAEAEERVAFEERLERRMKIQQRAKELAGGQRVDLSAPVTVPPQAQTDHQAQNPVPPVKKGISEN